MVWSYWYKKGLLQYHSYPESVNYNEYEGSWLLLGRTNYLLDEIERDLRMHGLIYKRNNRLPISKKLLNAVDAWRRLSVGEKIELSAVKDMYAYMSTDIGVERGHKGLKTAEQKTYELEDLVLNQQC